MTARVEANSQPRGALISAATYLERTLAGKDESVWRSSS